MAHFQLQLESDTQLQNAREINYIFTSVFSFLVCEWKSQGISLGLKTDIDHAIPLTMIWTINYEATGLSDAL